MTDEAFEKNVKLAAEFTEQTMALQDGLRISLDASRRILKMTRESDGIKIVSGPVVAIAYMIGSCCELFGQFSQLIDKTASAVLDETISEMLKQNPDKTPGSAEN